MSRGIGTLQREILETLDEAHEASFVSYDYRTVYDLSAREGDLGHAREGAPLSDVCARVRRAVRLAQRRL